MTSSTDITAKRIEIIEAYRGLVDALSLLGDRVLEDAAHGLPVWVQAGAAEAGLSHEARAVKILQLITYGRDAPLDGRFAETRFGLIAASAHSLRQVAEVNRIKLVLKNALKDLKAMERENIAEAALSAVSRAPIVREALAAARLQRLHIKQSTRKLLVLSEQPLRMGFTLARGSHVVERLDRARAMKLAEQSRNETALEALGRLPADMAIARYRTQAVHVRCNLIYHDRKREDGRPDQVSAYLPIFYPFDVSLEPVKHNGPRTELLAQLDDDDDRLGRPSVQIDLAHPISESLGLYPYL